MRHLLLFLFIAVTADAQTGREIFREMLPSDLLVPNASTLGLDATQQQRLREGLAPLQAEVVPLQRQLTTLNSDFVKLLAESKPNDDAVLAKYAEMEAVESRIKRLRLRMTLLAKQVLRADQQQEAKALRGSVPPYASESMPLLREKLERVRTGIERMKAEGRDVTRVRELWDEFQKRADLHHYKLAMEALNSALEMIEASN